WTCWDSHRCLQGRWSQLQQQWLLPGALTQKCGGCSWLSRICLSALEYRGTLFLVRGKALLIVVARTDYLELAKCASHVLTGPDRKDGIGDEALDRLDDERRHGGQLSGHGEGRIHLLAHRHHVVDEPDLFRALRIKDACKDHHFHGHLVR